jgi:3-hydroxybutyrate dehydrogenase
MILRGRTALVTGSTSGIGLGIATQLARGGANIVLGGCGKPAATEAELAALGVEAAYHGTGII